MKIHHNNRILIGACVMLLTVIYTIASAQEFDTQPWSISMIVTDGTVVHTLFFGTDSGASNGFDLGIDQVAPPPAFNHYAAFSISVFPSWLYRDIRSTRDSTNQWILKIMNAAGVNSKIRWDAASLLTSINPPPSLTINDIDMLSDSSLQVAGNQSITILYQAPKPSIIHGDKFVEKPKSYRLYQNYPNPFNSRTIIEFQLPKNGWVNLKIYDLLGREVQTIVNQRKPAGYYKIVWDGRSNRGNLLSAGIYFYRIQINHFTDTRKMLYLQ